MRVSNFDSLGDVLPKPVDLEWQALSESLRHNFSYPTKGSAPLFSPAEWPPGAKREKATVQHIHFGVLDLDKVSKEDIRKVLDILRSLGIAYVLYSTWSYTEVLEAKGLLCVRIIVPFSRPVEGIEWTLFWPRMNAKFGGVSDGQCKDSSRFYFYPASPAGTEDQVLYLVGEGGALNVDALLAEAVSITIDGTQKIGISDLGEFMGECRAHHGQPAWNKSILKKILAGESLAPKGERDTVIFKITCALVERFPDADPVSLAALFLPSLQTMAKESSDAPTVADVEYKIRRRQQQIQEEQMAEQSLIIEEKKERIREAFDGLRDTPYTPEENIALAAEMGITPEALHRMWCIQKDTAVYILCGGKYIGPFNLYTEFERAALTYLAPASSAGVELHYMTEKKQIVPKDFKRLMKDYGQIARVVHVDLGAQKSFFNPYTKMLTEAPCPLRPLQARYHEIVNVFLEKLAGPLADLLKDWVAMSTITGDPCAALFIEGPPGTGKTMLAEGIARQYTKDGPTALEDAMAAFNSTITHCPIIFGDEVVPKDFRGHIKTGELRQFIQARYKTLKRKYMADAVLYGCCRLILAANNKELLMTGEALTVNDIEAIVERVLHIEAQQDSADFLKSLSKEQRRSMVEDDWIAEHALWLRDNRIVDTNHRFLVSGNRDVLQQEMVTNTGIRSAVCNWLVCYLLDPKKFDVSKSLLVRKFHGRLLVTSKGLADSWDIYISYMKHLSTSQINQALTGLCEDRRHQLTSGNGLRTWYRIVKEEYLYAWGESNGYADKALLQDLLRGTTVKNSIEN